MTDYIDPNPDQSHFVKFVPSLAPGIGEVVKYGIMEMKFLPESEGYLLVDQAVGSLDCYVVTKTRELRPKEKSTATLDGTKLRGLPVGAVILYDREFVPAEGKIVQLAFDQPGTYEVTVRSPTQLDETFEVKWP